MLRALLLLVGSAHVLGLSSSATTTSSAKAREIANIWSNSMRARLRAMPPDELKARQAELAVKLNITQTPGTLSDKDMNILMQEVQSYALAAKERYLMEDKTGQSNTTRMRNHRHALEKIMKAHGKTLREHQFVDKSKGGRNLVTTSITRLTLVEATYIASTYYIAHSQYKTIGKGMLLFAIFFGTTMLIYMDAGWTIEEAAHFTMEMPTTIGWGDMGLDWGGLEDVLPLKMWTTLHVLMSGLVIGPGLQDMLDTQLMDGIGEAMGKDSEIKMCLVVLFGTFMASAYLFSTIESCTCSYGPSHIEGCVEENCANTGGYTMSYLDALYMMVVSSSSIGYGDFTPKTWLGRILGVPLFMWSVGFNAHTASVINVGTAALFTSGEGDHLDSYFWKK